MTASTSVDTICIDLSPAIGREGSSKGWNIVSGTASRDPSDIGSLTDWRFAVVLRYKAHKELEARRKAKPEPLRPSSSMTGLGAPLAGGNCAAQHLSSVYQGETIAHRVSPVAQVKP